MGQRWDRSQNTNNNDNDNNNNNNVSITSNANKPNNNSRRSQSTNNLNISSTSSSTSSNSTAIATSYTNNNLINQRSNEVNRNFYNEVFTRFMHNHTNNNHNHNNNNNNNNNRFRNVESDDLTSSDDDNNINNLTQAFPFLFGLRDVKCLVCHKRIPADDVEAHLLMCLTKPRITYNEDILSENKGECIICLEDLEKEQEIARLPCLCIYHKTCINNWLKINQSCPAHPPD